MRTIKIDLASLGRVALTLAVVALAVYVGRWLWVEYRVEPWTRDGRVRANVVQIAPDVSGLVTEVRVRDNASVEVGDILFVLDQPRYIQALAHARAAHDSVRVQLAQARREDRRNAELGDLVAVELKEQGRAKVEQLVALLAQGQVAIDTARLNLARTEVRASVRGLVTNLNLYPGTYAAAGHPVLALVDRDSLHVVGYFEETKIPRINVCDPVAVRLMGDSRIFAGRVDSVAAGIDDRDRVASLSLLANVNPTFNWVRLAQRIPVRVRLDPISEDVRLIMGQTATVDVRPSAGPAPSRPCSLTAGGH
ncbi:biotin/lipoyl-binding protein [Variovorax sp. J22P168]|uniref:efflux RND transporter periplasmic adaptor subunit n=1 Tax=Variovorax jilinensis TaxID=3053513 RepID=UPI0025750085|nr:biotin/lipoyl-binding protein [Variovorax sp. J22P168]MDM0015233.1 biotin/lipoyl-binding protein [Variovorax sp. J22P168]